MLGIHPYYGSLTISAGLHKRRNSVRFRRPSYHVKMQKFRGHPRHSISEPNPHTPELESKSVSITFIQWPILGLKYRLTFPERSLWAVYFLNLWFCLAMADYRIFGWILTLWCSDVYSVRPPVTCLTRHILSMYNLFSAQEPWMKMNQMH